MSYIGVDIGTSGLKAAVVNTDGTIIRTVRRNYPIIYPMLSRAELDPEVVCQAMMDALSEISPCAQDATGLAISCLGEALVLLDEKDQLLANGILYLDERSEKQLTEILAETGADQLVSMTGTPASQMFSLYRLLWFKQEEPKMYARIKKVFMFGDYMAWRLCHERGIDRSLASRTAMIDCGSGDWNKLFLDKCGLEKDMFSPVTKAGSYLGRIDQKAADETGLPAGLKIYVGIHDQCAATFGAGAMQEEDTVLGEGSTESINIVLRKNNPLLLGSPFEPFIDPAYRFITAAVLTHGTCLRYFVEKMEQELFTACGRSGENIYKMLESRCAPSSGNVVFLPFLSAVRFDGSAGALGGFLGIDSGTDNAVLYRALLEGLAFETRRTMEQAENGEQLRGSIRAVGGLTGNDTLMQLKADVLQKEICVMKEKEAGVLALSMLCATREGVFKDHAEAVAAMVHMEKQFFPSGNYESGYQRYKILLKHSIEAARALKAEYPVPH